MLRFLRFQTGYIWGMSDKILVMILILLLGISGAEAQKATGPDASWARSYVGVNAGFGWGNSSQQSTPVVLDDEEVLDDEQPVLQEADGSYKVNGGLIGVTAGYNWQFSNLLVGLEGDLGWAGIKGSSSVCGGTHECGTKLNAFGTVRGRVGSVMGKTMIYATGGLAVGYIKAWDVSGPASGTNYKAGWTVGGGVEQRISGPWSAKLEYLYTDFGGADYFTLANHTPEHVRLTTQTVRLGLNCSNCPGCFPAP